MDKLSINPVDDHSPRFDVDQSKLNNANDAIRNLSKLRKEEAGIEVEIVGDRIVHKRTEEDYEKLWAKFLADEEESFYEMISYGRDEIERIGIKKFIDVQDWRAEEDVCKWKTDKAHVIICLHCHDDFSPIQFAGNLDMNGLCPACSKLYDLGKIERVAKAKTYDEAYRDIPDEGVRFAIARTRVMEQFVVDETFRKEFLAPKTN